MTWQRLVLSGGLALATAVTTLGAAGRQLTGQHAPASTPAMSPADSQKAFKVPEGFEVRLFASEPDVINPVAMTWDERGRLWVLELYEYPLGAAPGTKPRDRIKILEDTDNDGKADKVTIFADGLNLATGLQLGNGGVYVGQAPHLLFLRDVDGDGKADSREILLTGFGLDDRHELLNDFNWGPDGQLYFTEGVFTYSKVKDPNNPDAPVVSMNAALARFNPRNKKLEVFAEGTSNPWGVDWDRYGNAFVSACVIDHFFHLAGGGIYVRQSGSSANPFAYQYLPSIVDHKHHMAAYAGVDIYQGNQFPAEWQGHAFMGNIHQNALNHDTLKANGSSFKATKADDFLTTKDEWFRPVSTQTGPDGALWVMDWYDRYPCYQNANADPEGVDREEGRIWRVVYVGKDAGKAIGSRPDKAMNLAALDSTELVQLLDHANSWQRRTAQRILNERADAKSKEPLVDLVKNGKNLDGRLAALWTLHGSGLLDDKTLDTLAGDPEFAIRTWVARLTGERGVADETAQARLKKLSGDASEPVRLAVVTAVRQFTGGSLTVNTGGLKDFDDANVGAILEGVMAASKDAKDPLIPFMIWQAWEPRMPGAIEGSLNWFSESGMKYAPLSAQILTKTIRRICDTGEAAKLDAVVAFIESLPDDSAPLIIATLNGLIEGSRGKSITPTRPTGTMLARLRASNDTEVKTKADQLGASWNDATAMKVIFARIQDESLTTADRIKSVQTARQMKGEGVRTALLAVLDKGAPDSLSIEIINALSEVGGDAVGTELLSRWQKFSPAVRRAGTETLASRKRWALPLLEAAAAGTVPKEDFQTVVIRNLTNSNDEAIRTRAVKVFGRYRETNADKLAVIAAKRKMVLQGEPNIEAGHEVAKRTCFVCHKLHGEGAEVGPDLTGVGRSSLDALLSNLIDPNQIIGAGYENVEVETKDGRTVSGRMVENTESRVRIASAGPKEDVIAKANVASLRVSELSVMPEGLEQMPDDDFRNLVWYILAPPQDGKQLTEELKLQLAGESKGSTPGADDESLALWNPGWKVFSPKFKGAPTKLEFEGRQNVLMTHPYTREKGAAVERIIDVPINLKSFVMFDVAAQEKSDWELRVLIDGKQIHKQLVDRTGGVWKAVKIDLTPFAGKKVVLRLENFANDWSNEFGYWSDVKFGATPF